MSGLVDQIEETPGSDVWVDSVARYSNTTGTPLTAATSGDSGELISDVYTLTFASVVPTTSATVKVAASSANNPYIDQVGKSVNLDNTTLYGNIIPGLVLKFSDGGGFSNTWVAEVRCGRYMGALAAFPPDAGTPSTARRHRVQNTGSGVAQNCKAKLAKMAYLVKKVGTIFAQVKPFAAGATEKTSGNRVMPYAITLANVSGSGSGKTMDLLVDGSTINVKNLSTGVTALSVGLNVTDTYRVTSGPLTDVEFTLSQSAILSATANVLIFGSRFVQIAPDVAGSAGTYGTSDVNLTESGQSTGNVRASQFAFYWERPLVPDGGNSESNPYPCNVQLSGQVSSTAGWTS